MAGSGQSLCIVRRTSVSYFLLLLLMMMACCASTTSKCLLDRPGVHPRRNFFFNSSNLPIRIETSNRASHQLVSRILRILLTEVLGYSRVELLDGYNEMNTSQILNRLSGNQGKIPETMINLEVWVRTGFNLEALVNGGSLINAGPLGPSGRFGWFIPRWLVEERWNLSRISIDHWKVLRLPMVASLFSLSNHSEHLLEELMAPSDAETGRSRCEEFLLREADGGQCHGGVYYAPNSRCLRQGNSSSSSSYSSSCAVLLATHPDLNGRLLKNQIMSLDLSVGIAFLGNRLGSFVEALSDRRSPVLFFGWVPDDITATDNYTGMLFPSCPSCDLEVHQLSKMVWATVKDRTPEAYHVVSHMELAQAELRDILVGYRTRRLSDPGLGGIDVILEETACGWVRANEHQWKRWIPQNISSKTPIYIGGMFPLSGPYWREPGIVPGALMAVEYVNSDDSILPDHELQLLVQDTRCEVDVAMAQFLQYVVNKTQPIAGILGPGCSDTAVPIAGVSKHFHMVVISYSAEALQLTNRVQYPLFFRTIPHILQNGMVYVNLFRRWRWQQVALLAEDGQGYPEYHAFLKDLFLLHSIQVAYDRKLPKHSKMEDAAKHIEQLRKRDVRIIILTSFEQSARAVICEAYLKGMTASNDYVWFLPSWFTHKWWNTSASNQNKDLREDVPCTTDQMRTALRGHFFLNTADLGHPDSQIVGNKTVKQWHYDYAKRMLELKKEHKLKEYKLSAYASYAYDAVLMFALGLHKLLLEDPSSLESLRTERTVQRFMHYLNNTHFSGASGPVQFTGADRTGIIEINQQGRDSATLVGRSSLEDGLNNATNRLFINDSAIVWFTSDGHRPSDGIQELKKCNIEGFRVLLGVECESAIVVANVIGIGLFVVLMLICLLALKKWYDRQVDMVKRRMDPYQLLEKLNKWQIPRDKVVLNRKIGEGTSGTVYGGEANINGSWVAVAVKTLKNGASIDEKMDFLGEAEMMKQFDHHNIVKLLGVCTIGDPIYMIMEFVLHGDLKTFLLARRHMVGHVTLEADDVRPLSLTKMALDVANGLQYLSNLNFVHRDLACRNCLVNSNKTVLIGDFGMTKCMFDKDYYQLNHKGKFPVRWMAPESLFDGLFTTASDIWSYGVLLYEVMTFGGIPYPGHCNKDVVDIVRSGRRIDVPPTCSATLRSLLLSCWEFNHEKRPAIDFVIKILEENPELVEPCVNAPSSAIGLDSSAMHGVNPATSSKGRTWRGRLSSEHSTHVVHGISISSQDVDGSKASDDECFPEPNALDPFCASKRATKDIAARKPQQQQPQDASHRPLRFSLDSFLRSSRLVRSGSSGEPSSDELRSTPGELQSGFCCELEGGPKQDCSKSPVLDSVSSFRSHPNHTTGSEFQLDEQGLMDLVTSVKSKSNSAQHCNHLSKDSYDAENLPFM